MPIVMFNQNDILVMFDNTFVADQHEGWFDPRMWTRVRVDREHVTKYQYDRRGDGYLAKFKDTSFPTFIVKDL